MAAAAAAAVVVVPVSKSLRGRSENRKQKDVEWTEYSIGGA